MHSPSKFRILCLSNGHGEDGIAVRILQEIRQQSVPAQISALPLVGEGHAYRQLGIPVVGRVQAMPSGGFVYMDGRQLVRDLQGGLLSLTLAQLKIVHAWARQGGAILAVGDIVPLLFAWWSGAKYAFVGTAKSEYHLRDEAGWLPNRQWQGRLEGWSGSVYHPWEQWLMSHSRCRAVFPRDSLTALTLKRWSIPVFDLGNPMMDRLEPEAASYSGFSQQPHTISIVLLPGSRAPEAYTNWQQILVAVMAVLQALRERPLLFLAAIAPGLNLEPLCQALLEANFTQVSGSPISDPQALTFNQENASVVLTQHAYNDCLHAADLAIAMAGTATEQFVGLGKPAIAIPGKGPQFTPAFAEAQRRLLGPSLILVQQPVEVAEAAQSLLCNPERLKLIAENGRRRMGQAGAARRIAACFIEQLS